MTWMLVVGIRGPQHDAARTHDVSVDDDDEIPTEQRDDVAVSDTFTTPTQGTTPVAGVTSAAQPAQTPAVRPPVAQDAMSASETPVKADQPAPALTEAARPVPGASAAKRADTKKTPTAKAPSKKTPSAPKKAGAKAPTASVTPNTFIVQNVEGFGVSTPPKDEHDAWDDFGDFWGAFNPFMASLAALPPEFQEWKEEVIEQYVESTPPERQDMEEELEEVLPVLTESVGDTPQPDRYEQLNPIELPPILIPSTEETQDSSV
ncbi:hypothetical protein [Streptomyces sp. NPDC057939]|uniref:hypothetical protein n=1 Tax=Streptomyces sp. NPDC057939 TaxID=3346284 RepID=UPI0036EBA01A